VIRLLDGHAATRARRSLRRRIPAAALRLTATLLAACGGAHLVTVPSGPQPVQAEPVAVDFPPPPARIEEIPLSHRSGNRCVWRDGFWDWLGERWEWQPGRAVLSPAGCHFAEAKLARSADSLSFYRPAWYPDPGQEPAAKTCVEVACIPAASNAAPEP
jgi:hypothetical protein